VAFWQLVPLLSQWFRSWTPHNFRGHITQAAHLLYKIIASRNQKRSTALVTNVDFDKWGEYLSDGPLAMAFLDRLVEGAIILKVKGKSYRAEKANLAEKSPA